MKLLISGIFVLASAFGMLWAFDCVSKKDVSNVPEYETIPYKIVCIEGFQYIQTDNNLIPNWNSLGHHLFKPAVRKCKSLK